MVIDHFETISEDVMSGARDASEAGHQSWQVHALLWSPIQAGPAVGAKVGWGEKKHNISCYFQALFEWFCREAA